MSGERAVFLDNTIIDSAARLLSKQESIRRSTVGWCLRDISDISCLSTLLDAFLYFDEVFVLPYGIAPSTEHIGTLDSRQFRDEFRRYTTPLPLTEQQQAKITEETELFFQGLSQYELNQLSMPSLGRSIYSFRQDGSGRINKYPDKSTITIEETILGIKRSMLYVIASEIQDFRPHMLLWLSPERFLVARRLSLGLVEKYNQRRGFNKALSGVTTTWVSVAPVLLYLLKKASENNVSNFGEWLMIQLKDIHNDSRTAFIRDIFHRSLTEPIDIKYVEEWARYGEMTSKIEDALSLLPLVGDILQLCMKWFQEPLLKHIGGVVNWQADSRSLLRSIANEVRYLQSDIVTKWVMQVFSDQQHGDIYYAHELEHCANVFLNLLAGEREWSSGVSIIDAINPPAK